jgi:hypothetical protein
MMQNGPFYRFIRSAPFLEYAKTKADFSTLASNQNGLSFNPLSIVPASGKEDVEAAIRQHNQSSNLGNAHHHAFSHVARKRQFDIGEYVQNI